MMKIIKPALLILAGLMGVISAAHADSRSILTPYNQSGQEAHPWYGGASYKVISTAQEVHVSSKPCVFYGLVMSTGAVGSYAVVRDTDASNGNGLKVFDRIPFSVSGSTSYNSEVGWLRFPVRFTKGLTVELNSVTAGERVTAIYMDVNKD